MPVRCVECGASTAGALFCTTCGAAVPPEGHALEPSPTIVAVTPPPPPAPGPARASASAPPPPPPPGRPTAENKRRRSVVIAVIIAAVVIGIGAGAAIWRPWQTSTVTEDIASTAPATSSSTATTTARTTTSTMAPATTRSSASATIVLPNPSPPAANTGAPAPVTTPSGAAPAVPGTTPAPANPFTGDLGLGTPIGNVGCTGQYVVLVRSSVEPSAYVADITAALTAPGTSYLLTSASCMAFAPTSGGNAIYVAYLGPFDSSASACAARGDVGGDSYVKVLDAVAPDDALIDCP